MDVNRHFEAFGMPFPASDVSWKLQLTSKDKQSGKVVPYLDARAISDRLDEVVGQYNWKDNYGQWHCYTEEPKDEGKKPKKVNSQLCTISIYDEDRHQWISKTDGAENTDIEPIKGGLSDSFKRCAAYLNERISSPSMKEFIFDCEDEILLPFTYDFSEEVEKFLKLTKVLNIRQNRDASLSLKEQGKKNLKDMFRRVSKEYPKETSELLAKLWVLEEGEKAPNAFTTFTKIIANKDVLDFFTSLMGLAQ